MVELTILELLYQLIVYLSSLASETVGKDQSLHGVTLLIESADVIVQSAVSDSVFSASAASVPLFDDVHLYQLVTCLSDCLFVKPCHNPQHTVAYEVFT